MRLFEPITIGTMRLKNRIVLAPMVTNLADENGAVTPRFKAYYAERARGGTGLIIIESGYVHTSGGSGKGRLGLDRDSLIPGLSELVDRVHQEGAMISSQLAHAGSRASVNMHGIYPVSCSSIPPVVGGVVPRTLKLQEIEELVEAFGQAARRSVEAGFDAIQIHAAHGYLIHQFLSARYNTRQDRYGGTFNRRMRFLREIISRSREIVGKDYPLMVRMCASEYISGGITLKEAQKVAKSLENFGIQAIHVSAGAPETYEMQLAPMEIPRGCLVPLAEEIKKVVSIPVATVGRIVDPQMAEEILEKGKADLITLGRALLADPEFPNKAKDGRMEDIRPCIGCLQGCLGREIKGESIGCMVNALVGLELEDKLETAKKRRKVLIIGGGLGGMEAARVAALRGHEVTLWEKSDHLGGQFQLASLPPGKGEIKVFLEYLIRQIDKLGIKVHLNQEMTPDKISQIQADVVILAAGGLPARPAIPGVDQRNVLTAWEVLVRPEGVGKNVVIVGGGAVGAETAEFLADRHREVTLVEMLGEIALDAEKTHRKLLLRRLGETGVKIRVLTTVRAIREEGVELEFKGRKEILAADTVVLATGVKRNDELAESIKRLPVDFFKIGDCQSPRKAIDAIHEGFSAARQI